MEDKRLYFRVGVVVISALIITGILVMIFGEFQPSSYTVKMRFPNVPGVSVDTPIRKNGITIGRVSQVTPDRDAVLLEAWITKDAEIYRSDAARVGSASLINDDAVIDIVPGEGEFVEATLPDGAWIEETRMKRGIDDLIQEAFELRSVLEERLTQAVGSIEQASLSIAGTSDQIGTVAISVNEIINDDESEFRQVFRSIENLSNEAEIAVQNFGEVMASVDEILNDEQMRSAVENTLDEIPLVLRKTEDFIEKANETAEQFRVVGESVERNLKNVEGITRPLGDNGDQILADFQVALNDVDKMVNQVTKFLGSVNESDGNVGLLLNDRELYDSLLSSIREVEKATKNVEEITRKVKPIIADVRTTTAKIATDPRQLGIKGALDRRPVGSGPKGTLLYRPPAGEE